MPVKGGIVLDMNAMDRVLDFDAAKGTVKVQAGIRWADLDWFLEKQGNERPLLAVQPVLHRRWLGRHRGHRDRQRFRRAT